MGDERAFSVAWKGKENGVEQHTADTCANEQKDDEPHPSSP